MKKIILFLAAIFLTLGIYAQSATVVAGTLTALTLTTEDVASDTLSFPICMGEYDISLQFIPAATGSGSNVSFKYSLYQSNSPSADAWSLLGSEYTVTSVNDGDCMIAITDFKGLRLRAICTSTSADTTTVTGYYAYKKHRLE